MGKSYVIAMFTQTFVPMMLYAKLYSSPVSLTCPNFTVISQTAQVQTKLLLPYYTSTAEAGLTGR